MASFSNNNRSYELLLSLSIMVKGDNKSVLNEYNEREARSHTINHLGAFSVYKTENLI